MVNTRYTPAVALVAFAFGCLLAGCTSASHPELTKDTPAAPRLDYQAVEPTAELTLESVIVCKGPGSWKQDAHWDEYVVRVTNRTQQPLRIESAALVDFNGKAQATGWDPWQLEARSNANWEKYREAGAQLRAGAGADKLAQGGTVAATDAALSHANATNSRPELPPADPAPDAKPEPVTKGGGKDQVTHEFARRRIFLPVTMPPGGKIEGSLFFPMTPGPQRLVLNGRYGQTPVTLTLELALLPPLHIKPAGEPPDENQAKKFWNWVQKSWDDAFGPAPKPKAEK